MTVGASPVFVCLVSSATELAPRVVLPVLGEAVVGLRVVGGHQRPSSPDSIRVHDRYSGSGQNWNNQGCTLRHAVRLPEQRRPNHCGGQ